MLVGWAGGLGWWAAGGERCTRHVHKMITKSLFMKVDLPRVLAA